LMATRTAMVVSLRFAFLEPTHGLRQRHRQKP
jgi:hypothetical protein